MRPTPLIDAAILIDYLRGRLDAREAVAAAAAEGPLTTHSVAAAEVIQGALDKGDLRATERLLADFEIIVPTPDDFRGGLDLLRSYCLSHGVGWPDCLIAATAIRLGVPVLTRNDKHFRVLKGVKVQRPY